MAKQNPRQLSIEFKGSLDDEVPSDQINLLEMLETESARLTAEKEANPSTFSYPPDKMSRRIVEPLVSPVGWNSEEETMNKSGIPDFTFEALMENMEPNRRPGVSRSASFICDAWIQFYKMDPEFASQRIFKRFTSEPQSNLKLLNIRFEEAWSRIRLPSAKQSSTLFSLLENQLLTKAERWLLELMKSDGRITKEECQHLLNHFLGESVHDGFRWHKISQGVLHARRRTRK